MLHFVCEHRFILELARIERCVITADELVQRIEYECMAAVTSGAVGYRLLRLEFGTNGHLLVWYLAIGLEVTLLAIQRDQASGAFPDSASSMKAFTLPLPSCP